MLMQHWLWWHRHDADRTQVLVIFEAAPDFMIVSISDAGGIDQVLTDDEANALRQFVEDHHQDDREVDSRAA